MTINRRRQLIDAATSLFIQRGYPGVTVNDIAAAVGVTGPSVYRHFSDKQDILATAVLVGVEDLENYTASLLQSPAKNSAGNNPVKNNSGQLAPVQLPNPTKMIDVIATIGIERPAVTVLWRWNTIYLSDEQFENVGKRTNAILRQWSSALFADRPDLPNEDKKRLSWAILSVIGSMTVHNTRISNSRAKTQLTQLIWQLHDLTPSTATNFEQESFPALDTAPTSTRSEELLDAAALLFESKGYDDVSVDEIGLAVNISGPSVYKHYPSKDALLLALGRRSAARLEVGVISAHQLHHSKPKILGALVDSYIQVLISNPDLSVALNNRNTLAKNPKAAELLLAPQIRYIQQWVELLQSIDPNQPTPEATLTVHAALSIANDATRMRRNHKTVINPALLAYEMRTILGLNASDTALTDQ